MPHRGAAQTGSTGEQYNSVDPLFWILFGVVAGCLIGIIILWQLETRAEKQLAAQGEGDSSASLPSVDPRAEWERIDTRPVPATALSTSTLKSPPQPYRPIVTLRQPTPVPAEAERPPAVRFVPLEDPARTPQTLPPLEELPTMKQPATLVSTAALEELPTGKLPGLPPPQPAATQQKGKPDPAAGPASGAAPVERTPEAPAPPPEAPAANQTGMPEIDATAPGHARLRLAELARERVYLEHTLEANQIKLEELERGQALPDSEERLAIGVLQGEIVRHKQRLQEIGVLEQNYRQAEAAWAEQVNEQAGQTDQRTPKAFSARRLSRPRAERTKVEPPEASAPQLPPG